MISETLLITQCQSHQTPQVTLVKVSDDLFQSEEVVVPEGTFEGQLVVGEDVLSVAPFSTAGTIVTLHVTREYSFVFCKLYFVLCI